jgi:hypothetical protein
VRRGDVVVLAERAAHAGGDRLLARVQVHGPRDLAVRDLGVHPLLERADGTHHPVSVDQLSAAEGFCLRHKRIPCLSVAAMAEARLDQRGDRETLSASRPGVGPF